MSRGNDVFIADKKAYESEMKDAHGYPGDAMHVRLDHHRS